ncbi:MAG TPA: hypothetical protein VHW67_12200 [Solirubrobacteraceae bacterium]|jgi:hypothetical protein|nr:hypothetical protein [Solirubrobacteraceae bacterium]
MEGRPVNPVSAKHLPTRVVLAFLFLLALVGVVLLGAGEAGAQSTLSGGLTGQQLTTPSTGAPSATLEECVTTGSQEERAATFSGEMTAVTGTVRMAVRIDLEERIPGEAEFHTVTATGLGVWRTSDAKVKVYRYLKQVTNLGAPASYRGFVRFRWLNAKGHPIKRADRLTGRCLQPAAPGESAEPPPTTTTPGPGSSGTTAATGSSATG